MERRSVILIIDDYPDIRDGLEAVLASEGFIVETAANGREALYALHEGLRPSLILMDLMMPVMNGFEFREQQLRTPEIADIPVIAYSGVINASHAAHQLRAAAYLENPEDIERVIALVKQHCRA